MNEKLKPFDGNLAYTAGRYVCTCDWLRTEDAERMFSTMRKCGVVKFLLEPAKRTNFADILLAALRNGYKLVGFEIKERETEFDDEQRWLILHS